MFERILKLLGRTRKPAPIAVAATPAAPKDSPETVHTAAPVAVESASVTDEAEHAIVVDAVARAAGDEVSPPELLAEVPDIIEDVLPGIVQDDATGFTAAAEPDIRPAPVTAAVDASVAGLTETMRQRVAALLDETIDADARLLLESLAAEPTAVIRQLPAAAQRAIALTQQLDPAIPQLITVFEEDPTLAQALLTQANSSLYGAGRSCLSVRDALQRLGVVAARNVLMGHTVSSLLCRPGGAYATMVDEVWQHMVRTAPIARRIASAFNADAEEAFGLGLLHDVGKLVIFDRLTSLRIEKRREMFVPPADLKKILAVLHEPLGGLAVHRWNLGDGAAAAVATHHRNPVPAARDALSEVLCVAEAADLASVRHQEFDLAAFWDRAVIGGSAVRVERALLAA